MGVENRSLSFLSAKLTGFFHHVTDTWRWDDANLNFTNGGSSERKGVEAELETTPWHDLSLATNATWTLVTPEDAHEDSSSSTMTNLILRYRDKSGWKGELAGHYIWWNKEVISGPAGQAADLIWNLSLGRTVYSSDWISCDFYAKVYNLLDGNATPDAVYYSLPGRWLLAGIRLSF
jgi:hypothetical protein